MDNQRSFSNWNISIVHWGFFKIFFTLPPNLFIKIFFLIIYTWCTVGINVNFMIPLISLIDQKIVKNKT